MPSVYDFRHVELDKVGRGKRVLQAPGGNASDIFGNAATNGRNGVNGNGLDGQLSPPSTPVNGSSELNGLNGTNGHNGIDSDSNSSTPSSASSSRRGSRQEDTKNRLFGVELESPRRRVVDRMKSNIFSEPDSPSVARSPSVKKYDFVIRRNPITGEVYDEANGGNANAKANGYSPIHGNSNGLTNSGSASLPTTPVRVRQPPGGKCSGIF